VGVGYTKGKSATGNAIHEVAQVVASQGRGFGALVLLKIVEVLQEQEPGGLLGVIDLSGAPGFFPKDIIDVS